MKKTNNKHLKKSMQKSKVSKKQKTLTNHKYENTKKKNIIIDQNQSFGGSKVLTVFSVILGFGILIASVIMIALMDNKEQHDITQSIALLCMSTIIFIVTLSSLINSIKIKNKIINSEQIKEKIKLTNKLIAANIIAYSTSIISSAIVITTFITWFVEKI